MLSKNKNPEIKISNISKYFNHKVAINNLSLNIYKGDLITLIGPNGSGKTTLFKIISTILSPDSGSLEIKGLNAVKKNQLLRNKIGLTSHESFLYKDLTIKENLLFIGNLFRVENIEKRISYLSEKFQMKKYLDKPIHTLSKGLTKRATLIRTFLHDPEILLLDEPLSDLDMESQIVLIEFLKQESSNNKTIIISTHQIELSIDLKTQIAIINNGKIINILSKTPPSISILKKIYSESLKSGVAG